MSTQTTVISPVLNEQIDFNEILHQAINSLAFMDGFSNVRFKSNVKVSENFYSDKLLITPIVQHLIHNAIRYRKENIADAFVKIVIQEDAEGITITVSDNGVGIGGHIQDAITNMFSRITEKIPGHGLGLFTVNHCVHKLDGKISLESHEGEGSTVKVWVRNEGRHIH
ncbi:MAG: HAMP domain-containing histidine kinase [Cyclobacteriaceae bacterium]|nr:HAMP domain-containing histidine kinase [Cyclobacteriaceae bacterium]